MPKNIKNTIFYSILVALLMFGFSFALSPLYSAFCKATGFNSAVKIAMNPTDYSRSVTVQLVTTNNQNLPWDFYPLTRTLSVHPEETTKVIFYAKNTSKKLMTVQAIPSFSPSVAAVHFHKLQCFCFNQQTLKPGETIQMPVIFRVDKSLPKDVGTITLAYTLFDITRKGLPNAPN